MMMDLLGNFSIMISIAYPLLEKSQMLGGIYKVMCIMLLLVSVLVPVVLFIEASGVAN